MHHDEPCGPPHGDHEQRRWQPQPPPQEDHLENYLQRGSLDSRRETRLGGHDSLSSPENQPFVERLSNSQTPSTNSPDTLYPEHR